MTQGAGGKLEEPLALRAALEETAMIITEYVITELEYRSGFGELLDQLDDGAYDDLVVSVRWAVRRAILSQGSEGAGSQ